MHQRVSSTTKEQTARFLPLQRYRLPFDVVDGDCNDDVVGVSSFPSLPCFVSLLFLFIKFKMAR